MTIILVETYLVKPGRQAEFDALLGKFLRFKEGNPTLFRGVKSWRLMRQVFGGVGDLYIEMKEFKSLKSMEEARERVYATREMKRIKAEFQALIEPATYSRSVWSAVA